MNRECFVTGGSGFIGQHLLTRLTSTGHKAWVLMRDVSNLEQLREQVRQLGGEPDLIHAVQGDLNQQKLGLSKADRQRIASARVVFHVAAQFAWGLSLEQARAVNVKGALQVAQLAVSQRSRLLMVGGYMLQNIAHLGSIGIDHQCPETTDWPAVYKRVGGYEASKLEAHFAVIRYMQAQRAAYTIVHPATVCGHSKSGHILAGQPVAELIRNLATGKLTAIPGSTRHWLPLVSVDYLVALMVATAFDTAMANQQVLALDEHTPNLQGLLAYMAPAVEVKAPRHHLPLGLLRWLLKIPGVSTHFGTNPESLSFIRTERFDMVQSKALESRYQLKHPDIKVTLEKTARFVRHTLLN
jgi:nucleoside-diphosphate-sugar epimerase